MDKEKIKNILVKIGKGVDYWINYIVDLFALFFSIGFGFVGVCLTSTCLSFLQAFNAGEMEAAFPEMGLLLSIMTMLGLLLIGVPLTYFSLYRRVIE